jgi:hypothetical protein
MDLPRLSIVDPAPRPRTSQFDFSHPPGDEIMAIFVGRPTGDRDSLALSRQRPILRTLRLSRHGRPALHEPTVILGHRLVGYHALPALALR